MKPPKLKKLSKKELRKLYSNQWNQNIIAVGENYNLNQALSVAEEKIQRIVNWNGIQIEQGREYVLVDGENYRNMIHKGNRGMLIEGENIRMKEDIEDWKEAVSRSRNLMNSYKELAERKNTEKNSIEKMARMAHKLDSGENLAWVSLPEDKKDMYRVLATRIISEDPDKEKSSI